jgi:hypothetical protein
MPPRQEFFLKEIRRLLRGGRQDSERAGNNAGAEERGLFTGVA